MKLKHVLQALSLVALVLVDITLATGCLDKQRNETIERCEFRHAGSPSQVAACKDGVLNAYEYALAGEVTEVESPLHFCDNHYSVGSIEHCACEDGSKDFGAGR